MIKTTYNPLQTDVSVHIGSDLAKDPSSGPPEEPLIDQVHLGGPRAAGEAAK